MREPGAERCAGCNALAPAHPWVGIGWPIGYPSIGPAGVTRAYPVCDRCYREPGYRRRVLKMHFFPRARAAEGLAAAGRGSIGG